ncbi:hypothetical protein K8T06_05910 [bacterium]|nr:hypothetical protein [bacterium]
MKSYTKTKVLSSYLIILLIGLFCSGFFGKKKKDIDVKGIHSVAVVPFYFTRFKYFSENSGDIVSENMSEILNTKCKWETPTQEIIKAAIN